MHHLTLTCMQWLIHTCCHIVMKIGTPNFKPSHIQLKNGPILFAECSLSVLRGLSLRNKQLHKAEKENEKWETESVHTVFLPCLRAGQTCSKAWLSHCMVLVAKNNIPQGFIIRTYTYDCHIKFPTYEISGCPISPSHSNTCFHSLSTIQLINDFF